MRKVCIYCLLVFFTTTCKEVEEEMPEFIIPVSSCVGEILNKGYLDISILYSSTDYYIYNGATRGFHYELAIDFASYLGVNLRIKETNSDIDSAIYNLEQGNIDLLTMSLTVTSERKDKIKFSESLFKTKEVLVQNKNNDTLVSSIEELDGKTIYVKADAPYKNALLNLQDSLGIYINIVEEKAYSLEDLIQFVEKGIIEYTIADENIVATLGASMENIDYFLKLNQGIEIAWGISSNNPALEYEINQWMRTIRKNGKLNVLYQRYFNNLSGGSYYSKYDRIKRGAISPFDSEIKKYSKTIGWDWKLLAALIYTESRFEPEAESHKGASGLMQILPETANMFGVTEYFYPDSNIYAGVKYIKYLDRIFSKYPIQENEKLKFILASYNAGGGHVQDAMRLAEKYGKNPYIWEDNVEYYLLKKSESEFYRDTVCKSGYCNGQQVYNYVYKVLETYKGYKHITH